MSQCPNVINTEIMLMLEIKKTVSSLLNHQVTSNISRLKY